MSHEYVANSRLVASPPVNGAYKLYFSDRPDTVTLNQASWDSLKRLVSKAGVITLEQLAESRIWEHSEQGSPQLYLDWLIEKRILLAKQSTPSPSPVSAQPSKDRTQLRNGRRKSGRIDLSPFFDRFPPSLAPTWMAWQVACWKPAILAFVATLLIFYFGPNSIWREVSTATLDPLSSIIRILMMFFLVNIASVFTLLLSKKSVGYSDFHVLFLLKWGLFPAFKTRLAMARVRRTCSGQQGAIMFAQPMLTRMYMCTGSMLFLWIFNPVFASWPPFFVVLLRTLQQATFLGILFDLLPVLNNAMMRLLVYTRALEEDYLRTSSQAAFDNLRHLIKGEFSLIKNKRLSSLFFLSLSAVALKVGFIYSKILPSIAGEIPQLFGQLTVDIVKLVLLLFLGRFIILKFYPHITGRSGSHRRAHPSRYQSRALPSSDGEQLRQRPWYQRFQRYIILAVILLIFPFQSTVSGQATITEGKSLDIRSSSQGRVDKIFHDGPSDTVLPKGTPILQIVSDSLEASILSTQQEIANADAQIKRNQTDLESLRQGSKYQDLVDLDDQVIKTTSELRQLRASVASLRQQFKLSQQTLKSYKELVKSGAASDLQLRTIESDHLALQDKYQEAIEKVHQTESQLRIAQRDRLLGQGLSRSEELSQLEESLKQAKATRTKAIATRDRLSAENSHLSVTMPFKGVLDSSTSDLLDRYVIVGETLVTAKSVPLTTVSALVPEYDRYRLRNGMNCIVRLYASAWHEYTGKIDRVNPSTVTQNGLAYAEASLEVNGSIPVNFVGSKGSAKLIDGYSCLAVELTRPIIMFVRVDLWKYLPWR